MEKPIVQGCSNCSSIRKGVDVTPNPSSWESFADVCWDVFGCLNSSGPCGKRLIVHFSLPGTQIHIDIGNGKVKAAGVLCVLGISFGIGTYVLYKIYDRFIRPPDPPKPPKGDYSSDVEEEEDEEIKGCEEMGNQQSAPVDIPVYFKAGYGVSINKPIESGKLRNRKPGARVTEAAESILKSNLRTKNGLVAVEDSNIESSIQELNYRNHRNRVPDLSQLRIEIDESGFIDGDAVEVNVDKLSNSLKGNFSPTSLCEKNFKIGVESKHDIGVDGSNHSKDKQNEPLIIANEVKVSPKVDHLNLESNLGKSSVLLTPPSEDDSSSSSHPLLDGAHASQQSTKSDVSDIRSEIADLQQLETDDEHGQFSPLPYDKSEHNSPERICPRKLKVKLDEIRSRSTSLSANSSTCTSPDSYSYGHRRTGSLPENSLSGVSSPDLELLNSENTEEGDVGANTFVKLEDEIHFVEDEFESISKEIQELSKKYSHDEEQIDTSAAIFREIFHRYPSIRVRQSEKGIHYSRSERSESESEERVLDDDNEKDLSWDVENMMDLVYSEGSETSSAAQALVQKLNRMAEGRSGPDTTVNTSSFNSSSVNCTIDLGGSLYEDEFHLHLGTRALPKIEEQKLSPEDDQCACDNLPQEQGTRQEDDKVKDSFGSPNSSNKTVEQNTFMSSELETISVTNGQNHVNQGTSQQDIGYCSMDVQTVPSSENCEMEVSSELELCSPVTVSNLCNIGERQDICEYADSEWKGDTPRALLIREAYRAIPQHCDCCHLRRIRGDNYCGIRSTVYQTLANCLPPLNIWSSIEEVLRHLKRAYSNKRSGIHQWNFANRISFSTENQLEIMQQCLSTLYTKMEEMKQHSSYTDREQYLVHLLNSDCDVDLMEGVKLLMFLSALRLHNDMEKGNDVPVFAWLMFARDTSESVSGFVRNHLNQVGDSGGLEQVEMCLLGYSLGVRIRVFRLSNFREEDFISYYPEDGTDSWPVVSLVAEDDRHYNIPVL